MLSLEATTDSHVMRRVAPRKKQSKRIPFPGETFFAVPTALYDRGLIPNMRPCEVTRYFTLLRFANYRCNREFSATFEDLKRLDGISERAARDAHIKLKERGLIQVNRDTLPFTYTLVSPSSWPNFGPIQPRIKPVKFSVKNEWTDEKE
jgi:hypothetical protein